MSSNPTAEQAPNGNINIFWRGSDGQMYTKYWTTSWGGTTRLGGAMASGYNPSCEVLYTGNINCFYRATDGSLWTEYWNGSSWGSGPLGGALGGSPYAIGH